MAVIWHDLECGSYAADIPLWLELADSTEGPILEIGAGTGRVSLALAYAGHDVHALERDPELAAELRRRGRGLPLRAVCADAQAFDSRTCFELVLVPMQTIHLLSDVGAFLDCTRRVMRVGAPLAVALLGEGVAPFREELEPDEAWINGVRYASRPTALWLEDGAVVLERRREIDGEPVELDRTRLLSCEDFAAQARRYGFQLREPARVVAATDDHSGSEVMILHAG